jgi:hypothetical protein
VSPDTERVLGQITRGEIDGSADAARRIAARQEEQYGAAFAESLRLAPPADLGASDEEIHDLTVTINHDHPRPGRIRQDIADLLHAGVPQIRIARQLGIAPATVQRTREALGMPAPRPGRRITYASLEEAFHTHAAEQAHGGHVLWTGYADPNGTPRVCFRQERIPAPRVAFQLHHGRQPVGKVLPTCGVKGCIAGAHLADGPMREADKKADALYAAIFGGVA